MTESVRDKVIAIIAEQALIDPSEINEQTTLEALGLDSLALVEIVFGIEEAFDVSVPYNANDPSENDFDLTSVGSAIEAVNGLIADKGDA